MMKKIFMNLAIMLISPKRTCLTVLPRLAILLEKIIGLLKRDRLLCTLLMGKIKSIKEKS